MHELCGRHTRAPLAVEDWSALGVELRLRKPGADACRQPRLSVVHDRSAGPVKDELRDAVRLATLTSNDGEAECLTALGD